MFERKKYFVSYMAQGGDSWIIGNSQIERLKPITNRDDILEVADMISEETGIKNPVIIGWRRFEKDD